MADADLRPLPPGKTDMERPRARAPEGQAWPYIVPILLALLTMVTGYLALSLRSSVDNIDRRLAKIESALAGMPPAEAPAQEPKAEAPAREPKAEAPAQEPKVDSAREKAESAAAPDPRLASTLKSIEDQVAATRTQVDAVRDSIANLQNFASKAKDPPPGGFVSDEMLAAQKGLIVKASGLDGQTAGGPRRWLATPSQDTLDLLLKVPAGKASRTLSFAPKRENAVKSIDIYDRTTKGQRGRVADCTTEKKVMRCALNVVGPTVLQVVVKTKSDEQIVIDFASRS